MSDVIVIGKNVGITLGVIRSLGEAGFGTRLLALKRQTALVSGKSKYIRKVYQADLTFESIMRGLEVLRGTDNYILAVPLDDQSCSILDQHAEQLSSHYVIPSVSSIDGGITAFMNKMVQKQTAKLCGLLTAEGKQYPTDNDGVENAVSQVSYPCFQKPLATSDMGQRGKSCFAKCSNEKELREAMRAAKEQGCEKVLLEEYLAIEKELTAYGVAANGQIIIPACLETVRGGFGESKGVALEGIITSSERFGETKGKLEEFVRKSGLTGLFCIDLIQSNGKLFFSEINLRGGGSGYAVTMAGVNLPAILANMVYNHSIEESGNIRREVHFINEIVELGAFRGGFISSKEHKAYMSGKMEGLIRNEKDPKPWIWYKLIAVYLRKIKKLLHYR